MILDFIKRKASFVDFFVDYGFVFRRVLFIMHKKSRQHDYYASICVECQGNALLISDIKSGIQWNFYTWLKQLHK